MSDSSLPQSFEFDVASAKLMFDLPGEHEELVVDGSPENLSPAAIAVNKILMRAAQSQVQEIQIEPQSDSLLVQFHTEEGLQPAFSPLPGKVSGPITARIKTMAGLDLGIRHAPQVGRFQRSLEGNKIHYTVRSYPSQYGERIMLKLLDYHALLPLSQLIVHNPTRLRLEALLQHTTGLIIFAGDEDSDSAALVASILWQQSQAGLTVKTIEQPLQYRLPNLEQLSLPWGADLADAVNSTVLSKPHVMMVSIVPDRATAMAILHASQHCLVLALMPDRDTLGVLEHLRVLGINPAAIAGSLIGIVQQQKLRQVCPDCCVSVKLTATQVACYRFQDIAPDTVAIRRATVVPPDRLEAERQAETCCRRCNGLGYKGKIGVHEVLSMTDRLRALMVEGATASEVYQNAVQSEQMTTLYANSLELVLQGQTTLEEVDSSTLSELALSLQNEISPLGGAVPSDSTFVENVASAEENIDDTFVELTIDKPVAPEPAELDLRSEPPEGQTPLDALSREENGVMFPMGAEQRASELVETPAPESIEAMATPLLLEVTETLEDLPLWKTLDEVELPETETVETGIEAATRSPLFADQEREPELDSDFDGRERLWDEQDEANLVLSSGKGPRSLEAKKPSDKVKKPLEADLEELALTQQQLRDMAISHAKLQQNYDLQARELRNAQQQIEAIHVKHQELLALHQREKQEAKELLQKTRSELRNQFEHQSREAKRQAKKSVVLNLLEAIDSFEQANQLAQQSQQQDTTIYKGYQAIYRLLLDNLKKIGVAAIEAVGQPFDPNFHEAVMMVDSPDYKTDTVIEEFRRGYMMDDKILRPSQVKVAVHQEVTTSLDANTPVSSELDSPPALGPTIEPLEPDSLETTLPSEELPSNHQPTHPMATDQAVPASEPEEASTSPSTAPPETPVSEIWSLMDHLFANTPAVTPETSVEAPADPLASLEEIFGFNVPSDHSP